jgi:hypothetical protein
MAFQALEGLVADVVLDLTGILLRRFGRDTQIHEPLFEKAVALQNIMRHLNARLGQLQTAVLLHDQIPLSPQQGDSAADRRLGVAQILGHIDGMDHTILLPENQNGLQIVLTGLVQRHKIVLLCD